MIIDCISDLHGEHPIMPGGDLLIIAGDITAGNRIPEWKGWYEWLNYQPYRKIIYIAGNHDGFLENVIPNEVSRTLGLSEEELFPDHVEYLCDNSCEFEGLKIYGMPWTPTFYNWHFMKDPGEAMQEVVNKIPEDTEILITHGPAYGIRDKVTYLSSDYHKYAGCKDLLKRLRSLKKLKLHVFGHIHEGYGIFRGDYISVNASIMNGEYEPVNKPIRVILEGKQVCRVEEIRLDLQ